MKRLCFLLIFALVLAASGTAAVRAQVPDFQIRADRAEVDFPLRVTFKAQVTAQNSIVRAVLLYGTNARTCQDGVSRQNIDSAYGKDLFLTWTWNLERSGALPPGAQVWWQWELTDAQDNTWTSPRQTITVGDPNFTWHAHTRGQITLQWAEGRESFGLSLLDIAGRGLDRLVNDIGIAPVSPILITIYPDTDQVQEALIHAADWTGGVAFPNYNSIIIGIAPEELVWAQDVLPHELAHLVVGTRIFNCKGISLPTWLSEGLAVYAEGGADPSRTSRLYRALEHGDLPPLTTLATGFSPYPEEARRSYAHSGAIVEYLANQFGQTALGDLLDAIQQGSRVEDALVAVYGMGTFDIDRAWRASLGYPDQLNERLPTATVAATATSVPTLALLNPLAGKETPTPVPPAPTTTLRPSRTPAPSRTPGATESSPEEASPPESTSPPKEDSLPLFLGMGGVLLLLLIVAIYQFKKG